MKVAGFTFVRNAIKFDYPVVEAITSILPICDEFIVLVGNSEDETRTLIENIGSSKIKIYDSIWDDSLRKGGQVLALETNKAFDLIGSDVDWAFYIQGDEIVHEQYLEPIKQAMFKYKDAKDVDGLLFNYTHFYGSYDYVGDSRRWYRREVRVIRNDKSIRSYRDAQGFRKNGEKLRVKPVDAYVYHYGWVKPPILQQVKQEYFHKLWHKDEELSQYVAAADEFDYSNIDSVATFKGTHPAVMLQRISATNWKFAKDPENKKLSLKNKVLQFIEKLTGWRVGEYKNYRVI